jgi:succinyl-diaminopimelate desuccinylase
MDERVLAERLITYDTSTGDGLRAAVGFMKGWLEARDIPVAGREFGGLPVVLADVGPAAGPRVILHGHVDVVPAHDEQFSPRVEGDRLIGRGAYDMKGALAAMMCAVRDVAENGRVRVRFICVPDEESEDVEHRCTDALVEEGLRADFAITGEPTDLHIGVQAKGVLAVRVEVSGIAAHGSTPWAGDNAILKAHDVFRRIETLRFSRESSDLFDRPSINVARIVGGDAFNKVPDRCTMDVDIRFLPNQDPAEILAEIRALPDVRILKTFTRAPALVSRANPYVRALREAVSKSLAGEALSIGRDGSSDAISFLEAGVPAVEFGPTGGGHHGPGEWVSIDSLQRYRRALGDFVTALPEWLAAHAGSEGAPPLRAVDGGQVQRGHAMTVAVQPPASDGGQS